MLALIFLFSAFSSPAQAADFCAPIEAIRDRVGFCDEDALYAIQAATCREQFRALAQRRSEELKASLTADVNSSAPDAQNKHFKTTKASYEATDAMLGQAIDTGVKARSEVDAFGDDLVAPFDWPLLAFGNFPGMKDPRVQELFRTAGCFSEPAESIDRTKADFDKMISDLRATRAVTAQLQARASGRELSLADLGGIPIAGKERANGRSANSASDVTGTARDKGASLSSVAGGTKLNNPGFIASATGRTPASDITKAGAAPTRLAARSAADSPFTTNLNPSPLVSGSREQPESVGSVLWESEEAGSRARLALAAPAAEVGKSAEVAAGAALALQSATQVPSVSALAAVESRAILQANPAISGPDSDLFSLVHARYRANELFRRPPPKN
jgi:hypothetical protein